MKEKMIVLLVLMLILGGISGAYPVLRTGSAEEAAVQIGTIEEHTSLSDAGADNDALFEQYMRRILPGLGGARLRAARSAYAGERLTGASRKLYEQLRVQVEAVANGQQEETEFTFMADQLELGVYSAADLGVSAILDSQGNLTDGVFEGLMEKDSLDIDATIDALLNDCPYDLYWFDKAYSDPQTDQYAINTNFSFVLQQDSNYEISGIGFSKIVILLRVAEGYQKENDPHKVDTALPSRVQNAAENIASIVSQYANYNDLRKLTAYKEVICEYVDYNYEAAQNEDTPYGDPWQLVYVFDGDSATKVVCEGYSKAFKYLCDRSDFQGAVRCILVSGLMGGGTGAGDHMWNIVKMPNDRNYLVDVTNSDAGAIGDDGILFMKGFSSYYADNNQYDYGPVSYVYDAGTLASYDFDTWLSLSDTVYSEVSVELTFLTEEDSEPIARDSVICGYPYEMPFCGDGPEWHEFAGWALNGDPEQILKAGDAVRIMEDTVFLAVWTPAYPVMDTPDFVLPTEIGEIGPEAFRGISAQVVYIPDGTASQSILDQAFAECGSLRQIYIPSSVQSIGVQAFDGCAAGLMIFGETGSVAQSYAEEHGIVFIPVNP